MQLFFFLSGSKRLLQSEVERFFSFEHAALFSLRIEEAALERNSAIFQLRTCSSFFSLDRRGCFRAKLSDFSASNMQLFFLSGSKRLLWSEIQGFFSFEHAALFFSLDRRGCFRAL